MSTIKAIPSFRMSMQDYAAFEKKLPPPVLSDTSTAEQAAHRLGVQLVLKLLREEFVIGG